MLDSEMLHIPHSARRYYIDIDGNILDYKNDPIPHIEEEDGIYAELEWVLGKRKYLVSLLVLVTWRYPAIEDGIYDQILPMHIDGNIRNLNGNNLIYKFKTMPQSVLDKPNLYYIPLYPHYAMDDNFDVYSLITGQKMSFYRSRDKKGTEEGGYEYVRFVINRSVSRTVSKHRLVCLVFKEYGHDVMSRVVNHLDGVKFNNHPDNLKLGDYRDNNIHALQNGLVPSRIPVLVKDITTGIVTRYQNANDCAKKLGNISAQEVVGKCRNTLDKIVVDGLLFKFDNDTEWPDVDGKGMINYTRSGRGEDMVAKNVFTGEVIVFTGAQTGELLTKVPYFIINSHVSNDRVIPYDGWNFRFLKSAVDWPKHTEYHLKVYAKYPRNPSDAAFLIDEELRTKVFYESVKELADKFGKTLAAIVAAGYQKTLIDDRYRVELFKLRENLGPAQE